MEAFYGEIINQRNNKLHAEYFNRQSSGKIKISENEIVTYRGSAINMFNEHSHDKREIIRKETEKFTQQNLNPVLKEIQENESAFVTRLGFENKISMFEFFSGINLTDLNNVMQGFLRDTEDIYVEFLNKIAKEKFNLPLHDLQRHDLSYITRCYDSESCFPENNMMTLIKSLMEKMEIDINAGNNIIFDMAKRENKSPRAFCTPVRIPNEVYLVLYPKGGQADYKTFLHELGHALHYSNISNDLEFEYKRFGHNSVTEGFAMTMDHLMMNEMWMSNNFNINMLNNKKYFINACINEMLILRRFAAKIEYEIKLNETPCLEGKKEQYRSIFENALKVKHTGEDYLADVDPYFYCARYIRAWMFQMNIHKHLTEAHGKDWFESPASGEFLKSLWSLGQKYNAEELLKINNCGELSIKPLYNNIINVLNN